jgi:hypothetical protein
MGRRATGPFEVKLNPQPTYNTDQTALLGRMSIDKQFRGDLDGTSKGEMLTAGSAIKGSAGYVAIERVNGILDGKAGGFALQHTGTMDRGMPSLAITVVPDSGVGDLEGIAGTMTITIVDGRHFYVLDYSLPGAR